MAKKLKKSQYYIIFGLLVLISWWALVNLMNHRMNDMEVDQLHSEVDNTAVEIGRMLEGKLMVFDMIHNQVVMHLDNNGEIITERMEAYGNSIQFEDTGLVSFNIAPDGVVGFVYPQEGNEMVIGVDLIHDDRDQVREDIALGIETGERIITGPVELIRGGTGLIFRRPIFIDGEFWGLVSSIVDLEMITSILETNNESDVYKFALLDESDRLIAGDSDVLAKEGFYAVNVLDLIDLKVAAIYSPEVSDLNWSLINFFKYSTLGILVLILLAFYWTLNLNNRLGRQLNRIVYYDSLTSLPNRRSLHEEIDRLIGAEIHFHLAFIDLDDFKNINDTLGHTFGDKVLKVAAQRFIRPNHTAIKAFRWGGDEFVLIFENQEKIQVIEEIEELIAIFNRPILIDESEFTLSLSVGVVSFPIDSGNEDDLIKKADMLMYTIKHTSKNAYRFYQQDMENEIIDSIELSNLMKSNRFIKQLSVHYQPKIDIASGEVVGMEALARWEVNGRSISPVQFIPIAEANGKIGMIDRHIIRQALIDTQRLNRYRDKPLKVSVNISGLNLNRGFIEYFKDQIGYIGIDPANIEVEVTENYDANSVRKVIDILNELVECGVTIAIDDFGQGYAALNYLLKFPAETIKIDREFIQNIDQPVGDKIVQSIMSLATLLGKKVVAEGVETLEQLAYLTQLKCNEYQGFIFSRPVDLEQFTNLLKNKSIE